MAKTSAFLFACCTGHAERDVIASTIAFSEMESLDHTLIELLKWERDVARSYTMPCARNIYSRVGTVPLSTIPRWEKEKKRESKL